MQIIHQPYKLTRNILYTTFNELTGENNFIELDNFFIKYKDLGITHKLIFSKREWLHASHTYENIKDELSRNFDKHLEEHNKYAAGLSFNINITDRFLNDSEELEITVDVYNVQIKD